MSKKTIHALLIAINDYTNGIRPLSGCLNDMHAFRDYLEGQCNGEEFVFNPLILENDAATREAVIASFAHFADATEGDVCVLYFSGHGSRILAPDFWEAHDGKIEAIVCYDACLADKELSCLIYEATQAQKEGHFLAVMDCCHAGSNTRFDDGNVVERLSRPNRFPATVDGYYGFDKGLYIPNGKGKYSAPKAKHINFGACRNTQTAKETIIGAEIRGAFTSSLIEALETSYTSLSYADLEQRVGQKIENRVGQQRPQVDAVNGANVQTTFLRGAISPKNAYFVANWVAVNTTPNIYHLIELKDTYHRYVVLISTEESARILGINLGAVTEDVWKKSPELRERVGREWTKEHYQNHRRERTNRFINELIRVLDQLMSAGGYGHLILAGNPRVTSQIRKDLPRHLAAKVVDIVPASEYDRTKDVVAATLVSFIARSCAISIPMPGPSGQSFVQNSDGFLLWLPRRHG